MPEKPALHTINDVEVFSVGEWNGTIYEEKDLDAMVGAFLTTKDKLKPYLKIGHGDEQALLQEDELPAAGFISNLRRVGNKLLADFVDIPNKIFQVMERGAYRRVSCEIWWNMAVEGIKFPYLLKAVSILGGETPAVTNLDDILGLYAANCRAVEAYASGAEVKKYDFAVGNKTEDKIMEELKAQLADKERLLAESAKAVETLEGNVTAFKTENAALKAKVEELCGDVAKLSQEKKSIEINKALDGLVSGKKIVPAQREVLFALMEKAEIVGEAHKYKLGEKELTAQELLLSFVESGAPSLNTGENTEVGEPTQADMDARVKKFMTEEKTKGKVVSYKEALLTLGRQDAEKAKGK